MDDSKACFQTGTTEEIAEYLLGMYLEHETPYGKLGGYLVDVEAYLGIDDQAAHSYGGRKTPRVKAMYDQPGTIYLYKMHTHLILNFVTQEIGNPQGIMIRGLEPVEGVAAMQDNRGGISGWNLTNGPGKLVQALAIPPTLYGESIFNSSLHLVPEKRRNPQMISKLPRIGIPNKGKWTDEPLRYVVTGNPYLSMQKRNQIREDYGWRNNDEKI